MQRPVMDPIFHAEAELAPGPSRFMQLRRGIATTLRLLRRIIRLLLARPFASRKREPHEAPPLQRCLRALLHRLAVAPLLLLALVAALVYAGTHPPRAEVASDPAAEGIYYDPVTFLSFDGTRLEGWLVPLLDARRINLEKEKALTRKHPAVVLLHDYGSNRASLLPLIRPLHEAGLIVLAVGLRGCGNSGAAGHTFGINESRDVAAAVEMLRRRQFVDPDRIGLLGIGTGATAALLAAQRDEQIAALVIEDPPPGIEQAVAQRIGPRQSWLKWMHPLCKWAFEIAYHADTDEIRLGRFRDLLDARPVFMVDGNSTSPTCLRPTTIRQIEYFLSRHLIYPSSS